MSKLIVSECNPTTVYQTIRADRNMYVVAIRPHIYIHGSPSGTVKVQIQDENGRIVVDTTPQTITGLKTLAYAHKYIEFDINASLVAESLYRIAVICGGGYSFSESAYVGVCADWDNTKTDLEYTSTGAFSAPLDIEIWERLVT